MVYSTLLWNILRAEIIRGDKMPFTKITNAQLNARGATILPNQPTISADALKREFDAPAKEVVAPAFNNLIDELGIASAAADIGATPPTGRTGATVQAVVNSISTDLGVLEVSVGTAIEEAHTHENKELLDTYTQTEANIADAIDKKHTHSNKELLDTYTQLDSELADAVATKHSHTNKSLLDSYTQTNSDISDAVSKKHEHSNKTVLDALSDNSGDLYYNGQPISGGGGGNVNDAYKTITAKGTAFTASGEDNFVINEGSNITITPLTGGQKGITISSSGGGGTSTGDMLMNDYDRTGDVKSASSTGNGIKDYVASQIATLDGTISGTPGASNTLTAFSETDGKVSATFGAISITKSQVSDLGTIPTTLADLTSDSTHRTVTDTEKSTWNAKASTATATTSANGLMSSTDKTKLDSITVPGSLASLTQDVSITSPSGNQVLQYDSSTSKWRNSTINLTITDTYSSTSHDGMSGVAVASAISTKANTNQLDEWFTTTGTDGTVQSNGTVTFSGIDDSVGTNGYRVFCERENVSVTVSSKTGAGTSNMTVVYQTSGATTGDKCYLRIIK